MADSNQNYNTKKMIFSILITILIILFVISIIFLILAIKNQKEVDKKLLEEKRKQKHKTKKYDLKTEISELKATLKNCQEKNNEVKLLVESFHTEVIVPLQHENQQESVIIKLINNFYINHKQEVKSALAIILICIKDFLVKNDPKLFKYVIEYFSTVFENLRLDFKKEIVTIRDLCLPDDKSINFIRNFLLDHRCLISTISEIFIKDLFNPINLKVYLELLNFESVNQEEQKMYNIFIGRFYSFAHFLFTLLNHSIIVKLRTLNLKKTTK